MLCRKTAAFSSDSKYFACFSSNNELLIWEALNSVFIDCKYDSSVFSTCTSLYWVPQQRKYASPKKAKKFQNFPLESNLLAVGTSKGDVLLYNVENKNLYLHLASRHSDAVNDMCFYNETNSFFTCSNDTFIAIWDITSGKQKSKWKAGESPVSSICVLDDNNLLSSSTSILWWNISEMHVIKEFSGHATEIFKLLPVNSDTLHSCYFLSAAVNDFKINAWSLNSSECDTPVASFVLNDQPEDIDISKVSSKDKPLILSAVTKDGLLYLYEHKLNGNLNQPIKPKASVSVSSKILDESIISVKLTPDSESCVIAYGNSKSNMTLKHVKIKECFKDSESQNSISHFNNSEDILCVVNERSQKTKSLPINGVKSTTSESSPKKTRCKEKESAVDSGYRRKLRSSCSVEYSAEPKLSNAYENEDKSSCCIEEICIKDSRVAVDHLLRGLQTQDEDVLNMIFSNNNTEWISASVKHLPTSSLKEILSELNHRLQHHKKYSPTLRIWLKEILQVHLNYLIQSQDTIEIVNCIRKQLDSMKISETISKLSILKGFLTLQMQNSSSEDTDSDIESPMES